MKFTSVSNNETCIKLSDVWWNRNKGLYLKIYKMAFSIRFKFYEKNKINMHCKDNVLCCNNCRLLCVKVTAEKWKEKSRTICNSYNSEWNLLWNNEWSAYVCKPYMKQLAKKKLTTWILWLSSLIVCVLRHIKLVLWSHYSEKRF